jgi:hypothetical protein
VTEADTRLKVIDPILGTVLGWPLQDISTEPSTDTGYIDYACFTEDRTRLNIGVYLTNGVSGGQLVRLGGPGTGRRR